jgi:hypothetical protein
MHKSHLKIFLLHQPQQQSNDICPQSPVEKPLRPNGNNAKPPHHRPYKAQIMAPTPTAEELKTFLSLRNIDIVLISETHFT